MTAAQAIARLLASWNDPHALLLLVLDLAEQLHDHAHADRDDAVRRARAGATPGNYSL